MKILGLSDEVCTCQCCGRSGLKCTVALVPDDGGEPMFYGRDCAAKAVMGNKSASTVKAVENVASAASYAAKWIAARPELASDEVYLGKIANQIRIRFTNAWVENGRLFIAGLGEAA